MKIILVFVFFFLFQGAGFSQPREDLVLLNQKLDDLVVCLERQAKTDVLLGELKKERAKLFQVVSLYEEKDVEFRASLKKFTETLDLQAILLREKANQRFQWSHFVVGVSVGLVVGSLTTGLLVHYLK